MNRAARDIASCILLSLGWVLSCHSIRAEQVTQHLDPQDEDALIHCVSPYSPRDIGITGEDTPAKLAIIKIWHQKNAKQQLIALFPKCNTFGQAYVLGALWHFDKKAFRRLAAEFTKDDGVIPTASGCIWGSETKKDLIKLMQDSNSTMAFANPPLTKLERIQLEEQEPDKKLVEMDKNPELRRARKDYEIGVKWEMVPDMRLQLTPKIKRSIEYSVEWGWMKKGKRWTVNPSIEEVTEVLEEMDQTPFIQEINRQTPLDIQIEAMDGNFYDLCLGEDMKPKENEEANEAKALLGSIGRRDTAKLVKILAFSDAGPLIMWHPWHSQFWMITSNLKINPEWREEYRQQTGLELTNYETAPGWVGTCDGQGKLTMMRSSIAKTIQER